ncbi:MAG: hypothetical protein ACI4EE_03785 [Lachnospiraceae bacterium]
MIAEKNQYMSRAAEEMYARNADESIREQCRVREENLAYDRYVKEQMELLEKLQKELAEKDQAIDDQKKTIVQMTQERAEDKKLIAELQAKLSNQ